MTTTTYTISHLTEDHVRKNRLIVFAIPILIILVLRNFIGIDISDNITVFVAAIAFISLNKAETVAFLFFLLPFKSGLGYSSVVLLFCVISVFKYRFKLLRHDLLIVIFLLIEFLNISIGGRDYVEGFRYAIYFVCLVLLDHYVEDLTSQPDRLPDVAKAYMIAALIASCFVVLKYIGENGLRSILEGGFRVGQTRRYNDLSGMIIGFNPNEMGGICLMGIALGITLCMKNRMRKSSMFLYLAVLSMIGILTQSRMFLITYGCMMLYFTFMRVKREAIWKRVSIIVIFILAIFLLYQFILKDAIDVLFERFFEDDIETGNGRTTILVDFWNIFVMNPLRMFFGYGVLDYRFYSTYRWTLHNGSFELVFSSGLIGTSLFITWVILVLRRYRRISGLEKRELAVNLMPLFVLFVFIQGGQFMSQYNIILRTGLCIIIAGVQYNKRSSKGKVLKMQNRKHSTI